MPRFTLLLGRDLEALDASASRMADQWRAARPRSVTLRAPQAAHWPFIHPLTIDPNAPAIVRMPAIHEAFVNRQTLGTRLVTTQAGYLMQSWFDAAGNADVLFLATGNREAIAEHAPEVLARRGIFADALILDDETSTAVEGWAAGSTLHDLPTSAVAYDPESAITLANAFRQSEPVERLARCVEALARGRTPGTLLAAASVCMEVNDLERAGQDLDSALADAPDWAAAHFERGKLWLRLDDMDRASECFRAATERMPAFSSAWANLGAALGELDRPEEALAAFERVLATDPENQQALNNVGVVRRELGLLAESEVAFRRVTELAPDLAFGYYNLGHTLFLQGRYQAALSAYGEGQRRDGAPNPVQATRLAVCRLATGDAVGAIGELQRATGALPADYRRQLLADTSAIVWALLTDRPDVPGWHRVNDWLAAELARP